MMRRKTMAESGTVLAAIRGATAAAVRVAAAIAVLLSAAAPLAAEEYLVDEGDVLQISVFDHPDLATTVRVTADRQITVPLVGALSVQGLTVPQVATLVAARLGDGYILGPQVTVTVQEYRARKVNVIGRVNRPGAYEFRGRLTLLELLTRAGGLAPDAGATAAISGRAGEAARTVDLRALLLQGNTALDIEIRDGDSVHIAEAGVFYLTGEVRRPGEYRFEEGMTLLRAVTLAGGFTERAATDRIKVVREEGGLQRLIEYGSGNAALEATVRRGDIVVVNVAREEFCYVTGEVRSAGAYHCGPGTTVLQAVALAGGFTDAAAKGKIRIIRRAGGQEQVHDRVSLDEPVVPDDVIVVPRSFF